MKCMDLAVALIRLLPAECAHNLTVNLSAAFTPLVPRARADDPALAVKALGLDFSNPLGMAAGFDKNARAFEAMFRLGFGHVECGTVTPLAQPGNPRPRMYRLPQDKAIINRMGFNNYGMDYAAKKLMARRPGKGVLGINIGANKLSEDRVKDYRTGFARLAPLADYVTVNISSPNTPGLRKLQDRDALHALLQVIAETRAAAAIQTPVLLKIAPDIGDEGLDAIAEEVLAAGIDGMIVTNTTISRAGLKSPQAKEVGGLSGRPLFCPANEVLSGMRTRVGTKLTLIGSGGVASGADAYAKIRAGASLVQVYTALVFHGIGLLEDIKRDLIAALKRDGFASVQDAIGVDAR